MEVEPLDHTKLEDFDLNICSHDIFLSSREIPSVDEPEPQLLPNFSPLEVNLGDKRGTDPPIKPHSPDSYRMKVVDKSIINTPPSPHMASFHPKDTYCYYHPCTNDPKKHYGFKPDLLRQSGSLAGSESRPPMLNKENYVPWSSRLLRYAKNDELTDKEIKQIEADDQAIQTILLGLPEDIYAAVDSCETAQEIWLRVQQIMKGFDIRIQEKKAKLFNEWKRFTSNERESIESYYHHFLKLMNDLKRNKHFPEKIASNLKFLNNLQPEWSRHVTIVHQTKDLQTAYYTQLYDFLKYIKRRQMQMVGGNGGNQFRQYAGQNVGNTAGYNDVIKNRVIQNAVQNPRVQNVRNQNGLIGVQGNGNQNQIGNGNPVAARTERNAAGQNGIQI
nr:hypothetical protein [Tanacetum cinerariifolium]